MKQQTLTQNQIVALRQNGQLQENETAYFHGDLLIAENVLTNQKRVLESHGLVQETKKRILKG